MWTLRLRDPRTLAALVALLALLAAGLAYDLRRAVEYGEELVLSLPWGQGEGSVGLWRGGDGRAYGPPSFAVAPDGRVAVLDAAGQRVLLFDAQGRPLAAWPLAVPPGAPPGPTAGAAGGGPAAAPGAAAGPWWTDVAFAPHGGLWVVDAAGARVLELDAAGQVRRAVALPAPAPPDGRPLVVADRVAVDPQGTVYVAQTVVAEGLYGRRLLRLDPAGPAGVLDFALRPGGAVEATGPAPLAPVHSFAPDREGGLVVEAPWAGDPFRRLIRRYDRTGRLLAEWAVDSPQLLRSAEVLGRDRLGGLVLLLNPGRPDGRAVRYDPEGTPRLVRPVPWHPQYPLVVYGRMDARGNLYLAVPDSQGWHLLRLRLRTPWRLAPRGAGDPAGEP